MIKILVLEDEVSIRDMLSFALENIGYEVFPCGHANEATHCLQNEPIDIALVDWMLPDISGLEWIQQVRQTSQKGDLPIIMLTAKDAESARIEGLESGADDYLVKPFSPRELVARINALLRRTATHVDNSNQSNVQNKSILSYGALKIDTIAYRVYVDDEEVDIGPKEYQLLMYLMRSPNRVFSRAQMIDGVWGQQVYIEERTVDVHIRRLRRALEKYGQHNLIQTVRGAGYRFG